MEGNDGVRRRSFPWCEIDLRFSVIDWSFQSLFDRQIDVSCPVASSSSIRLVAPDLHGYKLSPEPLSSNDAVSVYSPTSRKGAAFCPYGKPTLTLVF